MNNGSKTSGRFAPERWLLVALIIGVWILVLRTGWMSPVQNPSLYIMNPASSDGCKALGPRVGTRTDRFDLLDVYWLGGSKTSGICVVEVHLSGYGAAKSVSATRFVHYLRDEVGISEKDLKTAFTVDKN